MKRMFTTVPGNGFANAKRSATYALKRNLDSNFNPTEKSYREAMSYLEPYLDSSNESLSLQAQNIYAGYENSIGKMAKKAIDQNETVASLKKQEREAYFTSFDSGDSAENSMRNPSQIILDASYELDKVLLQVQSAIDDKIDTNESDDALKTYKEELSKRASVFRELKNKINSGEPLEGQEINGLGYYVDSDPDSGAIRGAGIIPILDAPEGIGKGFKRIDSTAGIFGATIPVFAPSITDAEGKYFAKIGNYKWTDMGDATLTSDAQNSATGIVPKILNSGGFDISDRNLFPSAKRDIKRGEFGTGFVGLDKEGNEITATFFKGHDGKIYSVDESTREKFMKDPILSKKLSGYIPSFGGDEVKNFAVQSTQMSDDRISTESRLFNSLESAAAYRAESDRMQNRGFFQEFGDGLTTLNQKYGGAAEDMAAPQPAPTDINAQDPNMFSTQTKDTTFFAAKNTPNKPDAQSVQNSAPDLIDKGKSFFRNVYNKVVNAK